MQTEVKNIKDQQLELTITLLAEELRKFLVLAEKRLSQQHSRPGFRPGKVPQELAKEEVGQEKMLSEGFRLAIGSSLADALAQEKIDALHTGDLKVIINSAEELKFSVTVMPFPKVTLGEYKGLAVERKPTTATEAEIDETLNFVRRSRVKRDAAPSDGESLAPEGREANIKEPIKDEELPALDDEFARSLGKFNNLAELRNNIGEGISLEKEKKEAERLRIVVLNAISDKSQIDLPKKLIEEELEHSLGDFKSSLARQGMELPLYLSKINKTEEDLRKEWRPRAEQQLRHALILRAIARQENLTLSEEEVEQTADRLVKEYFQSTKEVPDIDMEHFKKHLREDLLREKIFAWLETENAKS